MLEFEPWFPKLQPASLHYQSSVNNMTRNRTPPHSEATIEYYRNIVSYNHMILSLTSASKYIQDNTEVLKIHDKLSGKEDAPILTQHTFYQFIQWLREQVRDWESCDSNAPPDAQKPVHALRGTSQECDRKFPTCLHGAGIHQRHLRQHLPNPRPLPSGSRNYSWNSHCVCG